jgi:hypothetical protein
MAFCQQCEECREQDLGGIASEINIRDGVIPGYPHHSPHPYIDRKVNKSKKFVEAGPSHDASKPCFAAYTAEYRLSEEFDDDDSPPGKRRPLYCTRIYDVTPEAGDAARTRDLAIRLYAAFFQPSTITRSDGFGERFEVVGMSNSASDPQQRQTLARMCADYDDQERAARMATGSDEFYIPLQLSDDMFRRALVMIDRLNPETADWDTRVLESWQDPRVKEFEYMAPEDSPCGSFSVVRWQPRMRGWEEDGEGVPPPDHLHLRTFPLEMFTLMLLSGMDIRIGLSAFYEHFVADGGWMRN